MKVTWEVSDGYAGGSRPHSTEIDDEDLDACDTEQEREDFITEAIESDFKQHVSWREISRQ